MDKRMYFRVCRKLHDIPSDYHEFGFETENDFLAAVHKVHRIFAEHSGECMARQDDMRLIRFRNKYGSYEDAWIYDFMLEQIPAPEEVERDREAERLEEELDKIFGFD